VAVAAAALFSLMFSDFKAALLFYRRHSFSVVESDDDRRSKIKCKGLKENDDNDANDFNVAVVNLRNREAFWSAAA
jgi:hypothetical protein